MKKSVLNIALVFLLIPLISGYAQRGEKTIAFTVDDLPISFNQDLSAEEREYLFNDILDALDRYKIKATGFVVGSLVTDEERHLVEEFARRGHIIGNHTYSHQDLKDVTAEWYIRDIAECDSVIEQFRKIRPDNYIPAKFIKKRVSGNKELYYPPIMRSPTQYSESFIKADNFELEENDGQLNGKKYFRYPYLSYGEEFFKKDSVLQYLKDTGYEFVPVTITSNDWKFSLRLLEAYKAGDTEEMDEIGREYVEHVIKEIKSSQEYSIYRTRRNIRQIFLFHTNLLNAMFIKDVFEWLKNDGWTFISVEEAMKDEIYSWNDDYVGKLGIPWLYRVKKPHLRLSMRNSQ